MAVIASRQSSVVLYSDGKDQYCHQARIVLALKGVETEIVNVSLDDPLLEEVAEINPYSNLPTLRDRDFSVFQTPIVLAYLDERFPYPPLLPMYPEHRAKIRIYMYDLERFWCALAQQLLTEKHTKKESNAIREELTSHLDGSEGAFLEDRYSAKSEITLMDCCLFPFAWRLPLLKLELSKVFCRTVEAYIERMLKHKEFRESLSEEECEMRTELVRKLPS